MKKTRKIYKSAITGKFIGKAAIKRNPKKSFAETVRLKRK